MGDIASCPAPPRLLLRRPCSCCRWAREGRGWNFEREGRACGEACSLLPPEATHLPPLPHILAAMQASKRRPALPPSNATTMLHGFYALQEGSSPTLDLYLADAAPHRAEHGPRRGVVGLLLAPPCRSTATRWAVLPRGGTQPARTSCQDRRVRPGKGTGGWQSSREELGSERGDGASGAEGEREKMGQEDKGGEESNEWVPHVGSLDR